MPGGMSGLELAEEAQRRYRLPALLMTGYAEAIDRAASQGRQLELLRKPFRPNDLGAKVHRILYVDGQRKVPSVC